MSDETRYLVRDPHGNVFGPAHAGMLRAWVEEGRIVAGMGIADVRTREWVEASVQAVTGEMVRARGPAALAAGAAGETAGTAIELNPGPPAVHNPLGIAGFIVGCVSACSMCCCFVIPFTSLSAVAAIVLGSIAWWQMNLNPAQYRNKGLAMAAVFMGAGVLLLQGAMLIFLMIRVYVS